jgi:thioredoxin-related protein
MNTRTVSIIVVAAVVGFGLLTFLGSPGSVTSRSSSVEAIKWHDFNEGATLAKKENKKLLVDVYTDWCVWCKKMDKDVYSNDRVRQSVAAHFVAVKLNAESSKGISFNGAQMNEAKLAGAMGVTGYPTIVFLDPAAHPITKVDGFVESKEFTSILQYIGEDHYKSKTFQEYKASPGATQGK